MMLSVSKKEAALSEYLDECQEMLDRLSTNVAAVESGETRADTVAAIYRDMHTIKGTSQLFGFIGIGRIAHALESSLESVRAGQARPSPALIDCLYQGLDLVSNALRQIRETKAEPNLDSVLLHFLPRVAEVAEQTINEVLSVGKDVMLPPEAHIVQAPPVAVDEIPGFGIFEDEPEASAPIVENTPELQTVPISIAEHTQHGDSPKPATDDQGPETIRVHVALLDNLMTMVGELVLIRNQLLQNAKTKDEDSEFMAMGQRLNLVTTELQNEVMKTRMQPIGNVLSKFGRLVRDLGRDLGKTIEIEIEGGDTELDKTIIEAVRDPLTHIVRNAVDHGIELPEERKRLGKGESGCVRIKACHESGQVVIEVFDDGMGLDPNRIGANAVEKGLITKDRLSKMTDREVQDLIFAPGFSTASSLSSISGRGVGMDVVKTNIERIGGVVDLASTPGNGTTIILRIPLTLAIVPAVIVRASGQKYAIPQAQIVELVRIDHVDGGRLETLQGCTVLRLRGELLPVLALDGILNPIGAKDVLTVPIANIVILSTAGVMFGLIVESIDDSVDVVVKSLPPFLKSISVFSGATIMGDGSVALTLDISGISDLANLSLRTQTQTERNRVRKLAVPKSESCDFLQVSVGAPGNYVIPLAMVSRIEDFDRTRFEFSGEQKVMRYGHSLLPIFSLPDFLRLPNSFKANQTERQPVIVVRRDDRHYGIEVCAVDDIVELDALVDQTVKDRPGILGTLIAHERVFVVVDVLGVVDGLQNCHSEKELRSAVNS